jgi:nitrite reductase/ring-hydroxylating ferredoxin subunit
MGGNLGRGKLEAGAVVCPVHGSRFDVCTGEVLEWAPNLGGVRLPGFARGLLTAGRPPTAARTHAVEEDGGKLFLAG